jgi:hypothetical protein
VLATAITGYNAQGKSFDNAGVDFNNPYTNDIAIDLYVLLSRLKTLQGLTVLRAFPKSYLRQQRPKSMVDEMTRLEELAAAFLEEHNVPLYEPYAPDDEDDPRCACAECTIVPHKPAAKKTTGQPRQTKPKNNPAKPKSTNKPADPSKHKKPLTPAKRVQPTSSSSSSSSTSTAGNPPKRPPKRKLVQMFDDEETAAAIERSKHDSHKLARVDSHSAGDEEAWGTSNMDDAKETEDVGACRGKCDKGQCTCN